MTSLFLFKHMAVIKTSIDFKIIFWSLFPQASYCFACGVQSGAINGQMLKPGDQYKRPTSHTKPTHISYIRAEFMLRHPGCDLDAKLHSPMNSMCSPCMQDTVCCITRQMIKPCCICLWKRAFFLRNSFPQKASLSTSHTVDVMAVYDLAIQRDRASEAMLLTKFVRNIPDSTRKVKFQIEFMRLDRVNWLFYVTRTYRHPNHIVDLCCFGCYIMCSGNIWLYVQHRGLKQTVVSSVR